MSTATYDKTPLVVSQDPVVIELGKDFGSRLGAAYRAAEDLLEPQESTLADPTVRVTVNDTEADWSIRSVTRYSRGRSYEFLLGLPLEHELFDSDFQFQYIIRVVADYDQDTWHVSSHQLTVRDLDAYPAHMSSLLTMLPLRKPRL